MFFFVRSQNMTIKIIFFIRICFFLPMKILYAICALFYTHAKFCRVFPMRFVRIRENWWNLKLLVFYCYVFFILKRFNVLFLMHIAFLKRGCEKCRIKTRSPCDELQLKMCARKTYFHYVFYMQMDVRIYLNLNIMLFRSIFFQIFLVHWHAYTV